MAALEEAERALVMMELQMNPLMEGEGVVMIQMTLMRVVEGVEGFQHPQEVVEEEVHLQTADGVYLLVIMDFEQLIIVLQQNHAVLL